jgi:hypothetical protein
MLSNSPALPAALRGSNGTTMTIALVAAILIIGLIVLGLLIWLGIMMKRRYDRDMAGYRDKKEAHEEDMRHYQRARERWEQLCYCMRDDIVFIPAENKAVPVAEMGRYLQDRYYQL